MDNLIKKEIELFVKKIKSSKKIHAFTKNAYAHKTEEENETLEDHMNRTIDVFLSILNLHNYNLLKNIYNKGLKLKSHKEKMIVLKMFVLSVYLHDMGKTNPLFQTEKMKNKSFNINDSIKPDFFKKITDSNHSLYNFFNEFLDFFPEDFEYLIDLQEFFQYELIAKHHSGLGILREKMEDRFIEGEEGNDLFLKKPDTSYALDNLDQKVFNDFMFVSEIMFDLLISSDIIATKYFYVKNNFDSIEDYVRSNFNFIDKLKINDFESKQDYNKALYSLNDTQLSNEASLSELKRFTAFNVLNKIKDLKGNTALLRLPTGIGKTNLSYIFINEVLKKENDIKKVFFINPLNNLNYQVQESISEAFNLPDWYVQVLNSDTKYDHMDPEEDNYLNEFNFKTLNYPFVITSHVSFFNKLFGKKKDHIMTYNNLNQSIIILDEIQLYNDQYLSVIYKYLDLLEKYLDTKILIISATIPYPENLQEKIMSQNLFSSELEDKINNHSSLKRFDYNFDFFYEADPVQKILEKEFEKGSKKILIVHNNIKELNKLKNLLKTYIELENIETYDYQNTIIPLILNETLSKVNSSNKKLIVFATTKIETGVDISFDSGIRYSTSIDKLLQFGGRVNRYGKKENSTLYVLEYEFSDFLISRTKEIKSAISMNQSKNLELFKKYTLDFKLYFEDLYKDENIERMNNKLYSVLNSNFINVSKFKLIESNINESFFVNIDKSKIDSKNVINIFNKYNINTSNQLFELIKININNISIYNELIKVFNLFTFSAYVYYNFKKQLNFLKEQNLSIPKYDFRNKKYIEGPAKISFYELSLEENEIELFYSLDQGLNQVNNEEFGNKLYEESNGALSLF